MTFRFHPVLGRLERLVTVFDAFGLALFCVTGALKALELGLGPVPSALMRMLTGIGGGILRGGRASGGRRVPGLAPARRPSRLGRAGRRGTST